VAKPEAGARLALIGKGETPGAAWNQQSQPVRVDVPQIVDPGRQRQCAHRSKRQRPACGVLSVYACARTSPTSTLSTVTAIAGAAPSIATSPWADSAESKTTTDVPLSGDSEIQ
jgi:hypothetical protein